MGHRKGAHEWTKLSGQGKGRTRAIITINEEHQSVGFAIFEFKGWGNSAMANKKERAPCHCTGCF